MVLFECFLCVIGWCVGYCSLFRALWFLICAGNGCFSVFDCCVGSSVVGVFLL